MDLRATPAELAFRAEVSRWIQESIPESLRMSQTFEDRREIDRLLAQRGYLGFTWPKEFGGQGGGAVEAMILDEELSRAGIPLAQSPSRFGISLVAPALIKHGSVAQQRYFLPRMLAVEDIWCQGFSEPEAGSDLANVQALAQDAGDHLVLNGSKIWTTQAHHADWCFVLTRTDLNGPRHRNLSYVLVSMHHPGIEVRPLVQLTGASEFNQVFFHDVTVSKDHVVGKIGEGWKVAMTTLASERSYGQLSRYRFYLAQLERLARLIRGLETEPLHQAWLVELGQLYADLAGVGDLGYQVVSVAQAGQDLGFLPSMTKLWWSETHQRLAELGYRVAAVSQDSEEEEYWTRLFLESRAETIYAGTSQIQRNIISERLLGLPRQGESR